MDGWHGFVKFRRDLKRKWWGEQGIRHEEYTTRGHRNERAAMRRRGAASTSTSGKPYPDNFTKLFPNYLTATFVSQIFQNLRTFRKLFTTFGNIDEQNINPVDYGV